MSSYHTSKQIKFHVGTSVVLKPKETLEEHIFLDLAEEGLLIGPGAMFSPDASVLPDKEAAFRIAFSMGTQEDMLKGLRILEKVMRRYSTI